MGDLALTTTRTNHSRSARSRRGHQAARLLLGALALGALLGGCSSQAIVAGNIISMVVTFGLFYTTINLRPRG